MKRFFTFQAYDAGEPNDARDAVFTASCTKCVTGSIAESLSRLQQQFNLAATTTAGRT